MKTKYLIMLLIVSLLGVGNVAIAQDDDADLE